MDLEDVRYRHVAPLYGEGRGLKHFVVRRRCCRSFVAPLYGEGRGLKPSMKIKLRPRQIVAPLYGEGRGLKPLPDQSLPINQESLLSMERGVD